MAKAVKFYSGSTPIQCDADCEVAVREDGEMFMRVWSEGRYRNWTPWWHVNKLPSGLSEKTEVPPVRLPNNADATAAPLLAVRQRPR